MAFLGFPWPNNGLVGNLMVESDDLSYSDYMIDDHDEFITEHSQIHLEISKHAVVGTSAMQRGLEYP